MTDALLSELAKLRGLGEAYYDHRGTLRYFSTASRQAILQAMGISTASDADLQTAIDSELANASGSVIPDVDASNVQCFQPAVLNDARVWGISIQLYTLRSKRNWGIGDFDDLCELIELAAPLGCDVIGLNPLHALFSAHPVHCSPYSPSSRSFINPLYIVIEAVAEFAACESLQTLRTQSTFQAALAALRTTDLVMYEQVAALKMMALRLMYGQFVAEHLQVVSERAQQFRAFVQQRGETLRLHALFETLDAHFRSQSPILHGWQQWPDAYRDPHSATVVEFATANQDQIDFHCYVQWLADTQLACVQQFARNKGMRIGLYGDLAVGANPGGSEVWSNQSLYVSNAAVGAPPDPLALNGQDWGIPPVDPSALQQQRCQPIVELLNAAMQHVGALRIDHVMSLFRLWWVPRGFTALHGVYVHYPLAMLANCVSRASQQAQCLVIGEDLGTVPDEIRAVMAQHRLYHYKVLLFEKSGSEFKSPDQYERHAIATVTTHDLPPLKAWWQGDDLKLRDALKLYPSDATATQLHLERDADRIALLRALQSQQLWQWQEDQPPPAFSFALARAIHLYLAKSNAALVLVQLEDLIGMVDPVNVPGTDTEHANWQRKITASVDDILSRGEVVESLRALTAARA